ncbi:flagellar motor switch protein FliN [Moellerella wisconsensis]|uniref:Flagellar motor switch protein FliN n=1 Tax=Moellerella wisconsensis TaxID=158849 RepID=A0A9Q8V552_9GAMM|nr:flagellar motor switch protein FliN [Moellerella wisconsensis]UNH28391.1 flagellar motor switch protein FliN [Moellerella wisconsensis]UNH31877.1 flagellar motor switch protein FliN [Moellerella wisconsensis]
MSDEIKHIKDSEVNLADSTAEEMWATTIAQQSQPPKPDDNGPAIFDKLDIKNIDGSFSDMKMIMDIPVKMTVELGRTKMTIKKLLSLTQGSVISLDGMAGEPLDILINGYLIAQGEVVVVEDNYGIRITDIITPSERMRRLSK